MLLDWLIFLRELNKLYERNTASGSVYITIKRCAVSQDDGKWKVVKHSDTTETYGCLFRAISGTKSKKGKGKKRVKRRLSTLVVAKDMKQFYKLYSDIVNHNMSSLKKKDKKDKSKDKSKDNKDNKDNKDKSKDKDKNMKKTTSTTTSTATTTTTTTTTGK